jgi:hypothetical protein
MDIRESQTTKQTFQAPFFYPFSNHLRKRSGGNFGMETYGTTSEKQKKKRSP